MPRDISGVYTLPAPMPVQPRTIPVTNIFNTVLADVKDALNNIPGGAIAPGTVDTAQLADNSVTNAKMADNAINTAELVDGAVTNAKMAANSVDTAELVDGSVTNAKIQAQPTFTGPAAGILGPVGAALELHKTAGRIGAIGNTSGVDDRLYVVSDGGAIQLIPNNSGLGTEEFVFLQRGQLRFPATANLSPDPNTMDDYEEGTFTPTFTCATPGNLSVTYTNRSGNYLKIGQKVYVSIDFTITAISHTTASGAILVSGLPFPCLGEQPIPVSFFNRYSGNIVPMMRRAPSAVPNYQTTLRMANLAATNGTTDVSISVLSLPLADTMWFFMCGWYNTNV